MQDKPVENYLKKELYELVKNDEAIFDFIQESSLDGLWYWDLEKPENEWMNARFWTTLGYDPGKMPHLSSTWQNIINQEDLKIALNNFAKHSKNPDHPFDQLVRFTHKNGSIVWIHCRGLAIRDKTGKPVRMLGAHHDITAIKNAELKILKENERAKESEEKYRMLVENLNEIIYTLDNDAKITYVSPNFEAISGYNPAEVIGKTFTDFVHPEDINGRLEQFRKILSGINNPSEYRMVTQSGRPVWVRTNAIVLKKGGHVIGVQGVLTEITDLKESENRLNTLISQTPAIIYSCKITDGKIQITYVNENIKNVLGHAPEDLIGNTNFWFNCVHPDDMKFALNAWRNNLEGNDTFSEYRFKDKSGNYRWLHDNQKINKINENETEVIGASWNISDRKKAEERLTKQKNLLEVIINGIPDVLAIQNTDHTIERYNRAGYEMLNMTPADVKGKRCYELLGRDYECELCATKKTLKTRKMEQTEQYFPEVDIYFDCRSNPILDRDGNIVQIIEQLRDITKVKLAEKALLESEKKYRDTFDNSINGLCIHKMLYDENGKPCDCKYLEVNKAFETHTGLSPVNLIGKTIREIYPDKEADSVIELYGKVLISGIPEQKEIFFKPADSWYEISVFPMKNDDFTVIVQNITDRKKAEQDLIISKEKAEESDRLKSAFLANMSHEIRTPMNGILGFAELLKKPDLSGDQKKNFIGIIEKSGERMLNIINDIIDISKIEAGLMEISLSDTNINEQIEYIHNFFKPEVEHKGMRIYTKISLPTEEAFFKTDTEKIYAILTNLVKNAIKYTDEGFIEFGYNKKNTNLEFFVTDTGAGIPEDRQQAIFERFVQSDIANIKAIQGAGLGLSITRAYVEMLGGEIWLDSKEGKGSTFYFTIPLVTKAEEKKPVNNVLPADSKENPGNDGYRGLKILIAEDEEISALLITEMLQKFTKSFLYAKNGVEAIEACRNKPDIDLVLMDIQMPEIDGYEAIKQIRKFNTDVIIIAQTAYGLSGDRDRAVEAGCNDYISKPISKNKLVTLIKKHYM